MVPADEPEVHTPAVSVRKSLSSPEYLVSLIDGKRYKTLKRHLASHGLTPDTYRERYGLPASYPMVAPEFAAKRREIAGRIGLGRRPQADASAAPAQAAAASPDDAVKATENVGVAALAVPAKPSKGAKTASPKAAPARKKAATEPKSIKAPKTPAADVPTDAPAEGAKPDAPTVEKTVAKPRKAKPAAATAALSEDTAAPVALANADTSSAKAGEAKPKKAPAKRPSRGAAKSAEAKAASAAPVQARAPVLGVVGEAPAKAAPKRCGKLGLLGKGQKADEAASAETPAVAEVVAPSTEQAEGLKSAKVKVTKPKRMTRTPKAPDTKTD